MLPCEETLESVCQSIQNFETHWVWLKEPYPNVAIVNLEYLRDLEESLTATKNIVRDLMGKLDKVGR